MRMVGQCANELARRAVPKLDGAVARGCVDDVLAAPPNDVDARCMAAERKVELTSLDVPYAHCCVF